ncbi:hypothetical protein [Sphaerisporangium fuscum]|uniref:hypothetical protein n=1 Tax=Sphaerisporangium fuscum TaxID=2835868 RepID=UPI001BDCC6D5|nr:hypothetical protein [Sphaerisporangium fuscum]
MLRTTVGLGLATALIAGTAAVAAPAQASVRAACYQGAWKLTAMKIVSKGATVESSAATDVLKGGAGTRLTLTATGATYDFTGSKKVVFKLQSDNTTGWDQYSGALKARAKVTGDRQGRIAVSRTGATGDAKEATTYTDPYVKGPSGTVRSRLAQGYYDGPLVQNAAFTCAGPTLTMVDRRKNGPWTTVADLRFTRL